MTAVEVVVVVEVVVAVAVAVAVATVPPPATTTHPRIFPTSIPFLNARVVRVPIKHPSQIRPRPVKQPSQFRPRPVKVKHPSQRSVVKYL